MGIEVQTALQQKASTFPWSSFIFLRLRNRTQWLSRKLRLVCSRTESWDNSLASCCICTRNCRTRSPSAVGDDVEPVAPWTVSVASLLQLSILLDTSSEEGCMYRYFIYKHSKESKSAGKGQAWQYRDQTSGFLTHMINSTMIYFISIKFCIP